MPDPNPTLNTLAKQILLINMTNGWDVANPGDWGDNGNINTDKLIRLLALITTEVAEAIEEIRKPQDTKEAFLEELADIVIRTLDIAGGLGLNIDLAVQKKLEKNMQRGYRHGGKRA